VMLLVPDKESTATEFNKESAFESVDNCDALSVRLPDPVRLICANLTE